MSEELWKTLSDLFSASKLTEVAAAFVLFATIAVVLGYGTLKLIEAVNKMFGTGDNRATKEHVEKLKTDIDSQHTDTTNSIKDVNTKLDAVLLALNNLSNAHSNLDGEVARLQTLVEVIRDKRTEDVADILIPVKLTLEHLEREIRENQEVSQETQMFVQRLHTDLSTLHGLIIGINSSRNRIK